MWNIVNWFTFIKLSQREMIYNDIGHDYGENPTPNILWFIDEDWKLRTQKVEKSMQTHDEWTGMRQLSLAMKYSIAVGRYDIRKNTVSIRSINFNNTDMSQDVLMKNIKSVLQESFPGANVINFNKQASVKTASPVVERDLYNGPNYLEIGHDDDMGDRYSIYIWYIDNSWKIHSHESQELFEKVKKDNPDFEFDYAAHDEAMDVGDSQSWIARGRVVIKPEGNVATYILSPLVWKQGLFAERKYKEKIEEILDKNFDNPEIYFY